RIRLRTLLSEDRPDGRGGELPPDGAGRGGRGGGRDRLPDRLRPAARADHRRAGTVERIAKERERVMNEPIQPRRVVITGMSLACALGFEVEEYWRRLLAGECGIRRLPGIADDSPFPTKYAGWIDDGVLAATLSRYQIDDPDRANQLALY